MLLTNFPLRSIKILNRSNLQNTAHERLHAQRAEVIRVDDSRECARQHIRAPRGVQEVPHRAREYHQEADTAAGELVSG